MRPGENKSLSNSSASDRRCGKYTPSYVLLKMGIKDWELLIDRENAADSQMCIVSGRR